VPIGSTLCSMGPKLRNKNGRAVATFRDTESGERRDITFGAFGTDEAESRYLAFTSRWIAMGRRLPRSRAEVGAARVEDLVLGYWRHVKERRADAATLKIALRLLDQHYASVPVDSFGPLRLQELREIMVTTGTGRKPWSRGYVNAQINRVREAFKWGVSVEMVRPETLTALRSVKSLRRGETRAPERTPVQAANLEHVLAAMPHLNRQLRAAVELQLLTAARPAEILRVRPMDIVRHSDDLWVYESPVNKTARFGRARLIPLGPPAIAALTPFMDRKPPRACFSPREADLERYGRVRRSRSRPGRYYRTLSYRQAIHRACARAGVPPFSPNQLRHWSITEIEHHTDESHAAMVAGHANTDVTRDVYIHRAARSFAPVIERCEFMRSGLR